MPREILYRYWALHRLHLARDVYDLFVQVCPVVFGVTLANSDRARDLLLEVEGISARDAVHAAVMINHQVELIASFDQGFDRVPRARRLELSRNCEPRTGISVGFPDCPSGTPS